MSIPNGDISLQQHPPQFAGAKRDRLGNLLQAAVTSDQIHTQRPVSQPPRNDAPPHKRQCHGSGHGHATHLQRSIEGSAWSLPRNLHPETAQAVSHMMPQSRLPDTHSFPHDFGHSTFTPHLEHYDEAIMNHHPSDSALHDCTWAEFSQCGTSPPCTNPACDDAAPCTSTFDDWCNGLNCLGDICYDRGCVSEDHPSNTKETTVCCDEECDQATRCISPCFSEDCGMPACDAPCVALTAPPCAVTAIAAANMTAAHHLIEPCGLAGAECVDPRCLTHAPRSLPGSHNHQHYDFHNSNHFNTSMPMSQTKAASPSDLSRFYPSARGSTASIPPYDSTSTWGNRSSLQALQDYNAGFSDLRLSTAATDASSTPPSLVQSQTTTPRTSASSGPWTASATSTPNPHVCQWLVGGGNTLQQPCGRSFDSPADLHAHVERSHIDALARPDASAGFYCGWTGCSRHASRSFAARPKLKRHVQTHTLYKPYVCTTCGVSMKTKDAMEKHARTHTGERPYACPMPGCARIFATSTELKTHMVVHSGRKPHECPICGEGFADSSNLSKHKKTHFVGMYRCPEPGCGARMKRWDQMRRHLASQGHCAGMLDDVDWQRQYKARMEKEWRELPEKEKILGDGLS